MSAPTVKRIGSYLDLDARGFLRRVGPARIGGAWRAAVDAAVTAYRDAWGDTLHSVYLRGSLAKGLQIDGVSDVDSFAVSAPEAAAPERAAVDAWVEATWRRLEAAHPVATGVELDLMPFAEAVRRDNPFCFILRHEAVCVHGDDLAETIAPFALTPAIAVQTRHFRHHLELFGREYPNAPDADKPAFLTWMMRRFLRLGMELVMLQEERYTRDLYLCYESFAKRYPERAGEMYRALELAVAPVAGESADAFVAGFGGWLADEAEQKLRGWGYLLRPGGEWERAR